MTSSRIIDFDRDDQLLSVSLAAKLLGVHASTIRRWIDRGDLPAYRIGQRRIGVMRADLDRLISPRKPAVAQIERTTHAGHVVVPPLTAEERQRGLQALAEMKQLREELRARRGKFTRESWELLNESRDERTRDLLRATRE